MALTAGHAAYAALHEDGINKFIRNVYLVRPHYFHYATSVFGGGTTNISLLNPLEVPGIGNVMQYSIDISQPVIDFVPQDAGSMLPAPLTLGPNQFSLTAEIRICIACGLFDKREQWAPKRLCATLNVWAVGHPTVQPLSATDKLIGLQIDQIVVKNICDLEQIVECIAELMVNALLEHLQQKVSELVLGAFGLILAAGPEIGDDQLKVWGDIV
ncbi:MAG TPA: hypothetical protein VK140_14995 [Ktedonobacteraceae bacterium]|nr:hypothetical protein [Ktedonobacteraceae bacterium]